MGRTRGSSRNTRRSSSSNIFKRCCKCPFHEAFKDFATSGRLYNLNSHDVTVGDKELLLEKHYITTKTTYICDGCLTYAKSRKKTVGGDDDGIVETVDSEQGSTLTLNESNKETELLVMQIVDLIRSDKLSPSQLNCISTALGYKVKRFLDDTKSSQPAYSDLEITAEIDSLTYIKGKSPILVQFLSASTNVDLKKVDESKNKLYRMCIVIENIEGLRNSKYIGPFSFAEGLVKWNFSGSKAAHTLQSCAQACGSITTLRNFSKLKARSLNVCEWREDLEIFADNTQKKGRTAQIKENATTPIGIATNVVFIKSNFKSFYQMDETLSPDKWLYTNIGISEETENKIIEFEKKLNDNTFRNFRYSYQKKVLDNLLSTISFDAQGKPCDDISLSLSMDGEQDTICICPNCCAATSSCESCNACRYNFCIMPSREELYKDAPNGHPDSPPDVMLGEVIDVNPNSYETIYEVLKDLLKQGRVGDYLQWIRVCFDGVPYRMALELIASLYKCNICEEEVDIIETPKVNHWKDKHPYLNLEDVTYEMVFGKLLLAVGAGHMEKNLLLAVLQLGKHIFVDVVADKMGFRSVNAKHFVTNVGDHHVSWQVLMVSLEAFAKELLFTYIVEGRNSGRTLSIHDLYEWKKS